MPSIIPDFEHDIFISYRHNDNQYEKWVTEFVTKLQHELSATVKGKVNIYFDESQEHGLLESHNVDQSLSGRLKSLIFIPIISQTYCDTESFAWKHEFLEFKNHAEKDSFGLHVELPGGNVASRILPVKIHDIDQDDIKLLERELSGVMRSIDFIYQSQGVNRSLRPEDDQLLDNVNQTNYRNQINKVANAVKDLLKGIKTQSVSQSASFSIEKLSEPPPSLKKQSVYSVSVPDHIQYQVISKEKTNVYLAWTASDMKSKREELALILSKAGFNVLPMTDCPADDEEFRQRADSEMAKCHCCLSILSNSFGRRFEDDEDVSFPEYQAKKAMEISAGQDSDFHTFIWYTPDPEKDVKSSQSDLVKHIRNNVTRNMTFSNSRGPMQLVDDMRSIMVKAEEEILDTKETDIFFIFSQQDELDAQNITDAISNEYPIEIMNILPDGEDEYKELSKQQIPKSKLAVIYFKHASDWAIPFIKQVWKSVGGASSPTPMLLVGEDEPVTNKARTFKAPKVVTSIVPKESISGEVKKVYSHVIKES